MSADVVRQWFSASGSGAPFVLLHPGGIDSRALAPLLPHLTDSYRVLTPDRRGHGRTPDAPGPISYELMAADTVAFIEEEAEHPVHLLGYSDGAVVALLVALARPDLVRDLVFVAGVFHRDGWEPGVLEGAEKPPAAFADAYAAVSPDGRDHFPIVMAKLARMREAGPTLTAVDLKSISCPVLVIVGDDDQIHLEHVVELYRSLPTGELAVIPHASHGVLVEKPELCATLIRGFHNPDKPRTFAPRRRAA